MPCIAFFSAAPAIYPCQQPFQLSSPAYRRFSRTNFHAFLGFTSTLSYGGT